VAGLTVAAVAVPQAMAYALVALPVEIGLYTAIVMTAVGAVFASSRLLINGPTNAISIAVLSAIAIIPAERHVEAAILLALLVGAIQLVITLLRLGDLERYISHSVIVGFTLGAGVLLVLDQIKNLLGLPARRRPSALPLRLWGTSPRAAPSTARRQRWGSERSA
jgi:SulP family sulfate permease